MRTAVLALQQRKEIPTHQLPSLIQAGAFQMDRPSGLPPTQLPANPSGGHKVEVGHPSITTSRFHHRWQSSVVRNCGGITMPMEDGRVGLSTIKESIIVTTFRTVRGWVANLLV